MNGFIIFLAAVALSIVIASAIDAFVWRRRAIKNFPKEFGILFPTSREERLIAWPVISSELIKAGSKLYAGEMELQRSVDKLMSDDSSAIYMMWGKMAYATVTSYGKKYDFLRKLVRQAGFSGKLNEIDEKARKVGASGGLTFGLSD